MISGIIVFVVLMWLKEEPLEDTLTGGRVFYNASIVNLGVVFLLLVRFKKRIYPFMSSSWIVIVSYIYLLESKEMRDLKTIFF